MELTDQQKAEIAQATIALLRKSVVNGVVDTKEGGQHVELLTDMETWKKFWGVIPQQALGTSKIEG